MKLIANDLAVDRGGRLIFRGLSFTLASGEGLLLTGPNGAGKTTLLRTIAGFLRAAEGEIRLEGADAEHALAEQCHYVGHLNGIKASQTVAENLSFWAAYLGAIGGGGMGSLPLDEALERLSLKSLRDIPAGYLSAGQKRRLGLARLLVAARPIWLLDEPTVSLDAASQAVLAAMVRDHIEAGGLAIAATHLPLGLDFARELTLGRGGRATP